jgi:hypothetical protein
LAAIRQGNTDPLSHQSVRFESKSEKYAEKAFTGQDFRHHFNVRNFALLCINLGFSMVLKYANSQGDGYAQ